MRLFLIEYYTFEPNTRTPGWEIHFAWVNANNNAEAREKARTLPNFDCVITCGEVANKFPLALPRCRATARRWKSRKL